MAKDEQDPGLAFVAALSPAALDVLAERVAARVAAVTSTALLSTSEAAKLLGLHPKTVERASREGRLPGARLVGRAWRIPSTAVEGFGSEPPRRDAPRPRRAPSRRLRPALDDRPRRAPRGRSPSTEPQP